ncbi:MAG: DUF2335 domain-containing protein [Halorhodospira sp.]
MGIKDSSQHGTASPPQDQSPTAQHADSEQEAADPLLERARQGDVAATERVIQATRHHQGPLPPAGEFQAYEHAHPGSAERILRMAEEEGEKRRELQEMRAPEEAVLSRRGHLLGSFLLFVVVVGATVGGILGGAGVAFAVTSPGLVLLILLGIWTYPRNTR